MGCGLSGEESKGAAMKRIFTLIVLSTALAPGAAHAQDDLTVKLKRWRTVRIFFNGRFWQDNPHQRDYLLGLMDMDFWVKARIASIWPEGATAAEVEDSLNLFYQTPANVQIPIIAAIEIIRDQFAGKDAKTIEERIRSARAVWNAPCPGGAK
jgi:hypothetical protein